MYAMKSVSWGDGIYRRRVDTTIKLVSVNVFPDQISVGLQHLLGIRAIKKSELVESRDSHKRFLGHCSSSNEGTKHGLRDGELSEKKGEAQTFKGDVLAAMGYTWLTPRRQMVRWRTVGILRNVREI